MDKKDVKVWYDPEGDYLEVMFEKKAEGGETLAEMRTRLGGFIYALEKKYQNKKILIVAHEYVAWLLEAITAGASQKEAVAMKLKGGKEYYPMGEARRLDFSPIPHNRNYELDFHRPYIDEVALVSKEGTDLVRVPDVFDAWFESGAMPYAQQHYPFENKDIFDPTSSLFRKAKGYPADFIAEGLDQTRGWFYSLLVIGVALFGRSPYKNVMVNGLVLAEDGKKMSKSLKNYPDPVQTVQKYGADAVRYYMISSPIVHGEHLAFVEKSVSEVSSKLIGRFANIVSLYELYKDEKAHDASPASKNVLDRWIIARLEQTRATVEGGMETYELDKATRPLMEFVDDLSTWYVRGSRDRLKNADEGTREALSTLRYVLKTYAHISAPFTPFISEYTYQRVRDHASPESVHLCEWPKKIETVNDALLKTMTDVRAIVTTALMQRTQAGIKVRQPLARLTLKDEKLKDGLEFLTLIKEEINVREIVCDPTQEADIQLDTTITPELKEEGNVREIIRFIQDLRKGADLSPKDIATLGVSGGAVAEAFVQKHWVAISKAANLSAFEPTSSAEPAPLSEFSIGLHVRKS